MAKKEERTAVKHNINPLKESLKRVNRKKALKFGQPDNTSREDGKEDKLPVSKREHDPIREYPNRDVSEQEHVSEQRQVGVSKREHDPVYGYIQMDTGYAVAAYKIVKNFSDLGALFLLWNLLPGGEGIVNLSSLSRQMNTTRATLYKRLKSLEEKGCLVIRSSGQDGVDLSLIGCIHLGTPFISSSSLKSLESLKSTTTTGVSEQEHVSEKIYPNGNMSPDRNMPVYGNRVTRNINMKYLFFAILACNKKPEDIISPKVEEIFQDICSAKGLEQGISFIIQCLPKAKESPDGYLYRTFEKGWSGAPPAMVVKAKDLITKAEILTTAPEGIGEEISGKQWREASSIFHIGTPQRIEGIKVSARDLQERLKTFQGQKI